MQSGLTDFLIGLGVIAVAGFFATSLKVLVDVAVLKTRVGTAEHDIDNVAQKLRDQQPNKERKVA